MTVAGARPAGQAFKRGRRASPTEAAGAVLPLFGPAGAGAGPGGPGAEKDREIPGALAGLRVLVVEDEAIIVLEMEGLLEDLGAVVVGSAANGERAVALAEALRPDFITMDVRLAGSRDGIDAAREIFERFGIRSIFVSAYSEPALVARAQTANPLGWIRKPFDARAIVAALKPLPPR